MNKNVELIGGTEHREIILVPYSESWPESYMHEQAKIQHALGSRALRIEHIGSTSIEGLTAKPIIDILLIVEDCDNEDSYLPMLLDEGYVLRVREPGHRMVRTPDLGVQIHIGSSDADWARRHILFRDYLRSNPTDKKAYETLKQKLATQEWETMNHYADAKGPLIQEITGRAEVWAQLVDWTM
jgi:Uncharacterized conserved protein